MLDSNSLPSHDCPKSLSKGTVGYSNSQLAAYCSSFKNTAENDMAPTQFTLVHPATMTTFLAVQKAGSVEIQGILMAVVWGFETSHFASIGHLHCNLGRTPQF